MTNHDSAGAFQALILGVWIAVSAWWNLYRPGPYRLPTSQKQTAAMNTTLHMTAPPILIDHDLPDHVWLLDPARPGGTLTGPLPEPKTRPARQQHPWWRRDPNRITLTIGNPPT